MEENKPSLSKSDQEQIEHIYHRAESSKTIENELRTEERYADYFSGFQPQTIDQFIKSYAFYKALWWGWGDSNIQRNESEDLQWINAAHRHLGYLQQKKLFDMQCLWRAEKITIPEIEICFDFEVWQHNILHCPFVEPITPEEVALYKQYLLSSNVDLSADFEYRRQDHEELIMAYNSNNENMNFPEWYDFHSGRTGTGVYLTLPDIRGKKEGFYIMLNRQNAREQNRAKNEEWERTRDKRPFLPSVYDREHLDYFVSTFEDKQTQQYYKAYKQQDRNSGDIEEMQDIIAILCDAEEPVPIEAHHDFREALRRACERHTAGLIAEAMGTAFGEYELNVSMGFGAPEENITAMNNWKHIRQNWYDMIIKGRVLNGEPADLNF